MKVRRWFGVMVGGLFLLGARAAEAPAAPLSKPAVRKQIVATLEAQFAAFRVDDWDKAYACASAMFRARIPEETFVALIMRNYPLVWKNSRADIGLPRDDGETARVSVRVFTAGGASADYDYLLVREEDGWRISGAVPRVRDGPKV